jgi:hypothetical protein
VALGGFSVVEAQLSRTNHKAINVRSNVKRTTPNGIDSEEAKLRLLPLRLNLPICSTAMTLRTAIW